MHPSRFVDIKGGPKGYLHAELLHLYFFNERCDVWYGWRESKGVNDEQQLASPATREAKM